MPEDSPAETDPSEAFERLRSELSLLRGAVEGLTAARENVPDYSSTLGDIVQGVGANAAQLGRIEKSRALALSPVELSKEITQAAEAVRSQDRQMLGEARDALARSLGRIDGMIMRGQAVEGRARRDLWIAAGGLFAGILLWSILPGAVVRSLPESWHAPEWMATRMMGMDRAAAEPRTKEAGYKADRP